MADLLEIRGDPTFKVGAYRRAADSVARAPMDVAAAWREGRPPELRGIGASIAERIAELVRDGRMASLEALREEVPPSLLEVLAVPGVGPRTAGEAWRQLGVANLADLEAAAREGRLRSLRGLGGRTEERILAGIAGLSARSSRRLLMGEAEAIASLITAYADELPGVRRATICGSLRRGCETIGDMDLLLETDDPAASLAAMAGLAGGGRTITPTTEPAATGAPSRLTLYLPDGPQLDVMAAPPGAAGSHLLHFTGSAEHNVALRHRARQMGWTLSEHGLLPLDAADGVTPQLFSSEAELYAFLGLAEIPPELREGRGEVEAAANGRLPDLVRPEDLRGDCHSHSDWSDGRESLEVMAVSARQAGREYQVITDHSQSLGIANGLAPARVERQRRAIDVLNERFARERSDGLLPDGAWPDGFRLLHGCELEITTDGRLDYDDTLLARFDVVVASLHVGRRQARAQLMARYELAMRSPHVDIISHPSGRKIRQRGELDLDWPAFYALAAETGTLLEVNGSEERLDLDDAHIRAASDAGCGFVISSDAHDRDEWRNLGYGVTLARRGWLEARRVANTLPLADLLALMSAKPHRLPG